MVNKESSFYNGHRLGILGGGQLGRMLIQATTNLNVYTCVLDPDPEAPCHGLSHEFETGSLLDYDTVYAFGSKMDTITIEIENVNVDALEKLEEEGKRVFPQPKVIRTIKNKRIQKKFYRDHNIPTADFILIDGADDLEKNISFLPAFQKLGLGGYDGGGVQRLDAEKDLDKAFDASSLLEKLVDYECEISVIAARSESGAVVTYPTVELVFHPEYNLVDYLISPAQIPEEIEEKAKDIAKQVVEALGIVGVLAVEMFYTKSGEVLVNEVAPRPHNSGHQTINANHTSQYEQHLRAIFDLPLGDTGILSPSAMVNVLGEDGYNGEAVYEGIQEVLKVPGANVFLYGKKITKPHRKMGHITILGENRTELKDKVAAIKPVLKVIA